MEVWGIVVAAGMGRRFGGLKHHVELGGVPIWQRARDSLQAGGAGQVVLVGDVEGGIPGGERRRDSVAAGLAEIPARVEYVLVHDAARPNASNRLVEQVVARLCRSDVDGVVPAVPVRDTLKEVSGEIVVGTRDRSDLVAVQTPQGFRRAALEYAHSTFEGDASDDASMVEATGGKVVWIDGDPGNLKLTYPDDLRVLEGLL
jgi:2-C-methyl-D-erythritol 4-phosphate cytidylyltransferase